MADLSRRAAIEGDKRTVTWLWPAGPPERRDDAYGIG